MSKMNRRDYLKQMGIGAAAVAGLQLEVFAQHPHRRKTGKAGTKTGRTSEDGMQTMAQLSENFQQWPETLIHPSRATILVTFHGLLDFYYNLTLPDTDPNQGTCGIGMHRGGGKHYAEVDVTKNGTSIFGRPKRIDNNSVVTLGIVNAAGENRRPSVQFLKNGGRDDFRRMIDMQAASWYPRTTTKTTQEGIYSARLFIRHGTFFTQEPTALKLKKVIKVDLPTIPHVPLPSGGDLGRPAEHIGNEIVLSGTDKVSLKVNGEEFFLSNTDTYKVEFSNICYENAPHGAPCNFDWSHFQEIRRNDFYYHRRILDLPPFSAEYAVILGEVPPPQSGHKHKFNTADAPCMGAGYGGGNGPCNC